MPNPGRSSASQQRAMGLEGETHSLPCQPRVSERARGKGFRRELTRCDVNPPGKRQQAGSGAGVWRWELTGCHVNPPGECQQAGSVARDSEGGTHPLSCQSPRRASASRRRGKRFRRGNSLAVMSIPQAIVSKPAARQGVWTWELTCCHVNPPGERQQAAARQGIQEGELTRCHAKPQAIVSKPAARKGSGRRNSLAVMLIPCQRAGAWQGIQKGTHSLSCQSPRRASASRQRGKGSGGGNSLAVTSIPQTSVSKLAVRQAV